MFFIGCPMWGYKDWVGNFFPAQTSTSDFLRVYSKRLNVVEGNTVFYALPSSETVARWCQETPNTFRFCPKVSRSISHEADISTKKEEITLFVERMRRFGSRLGPIFLQLPPSFSPTQLVQLESFLDLWPIDLQLAVEVRHPAFYKEEAHIEALNALLRQHNMGRVIMDTRPIRTGSAEEQQILQARERKPNLPVHIVATTNFAFVRYIGHPRMEVNEPFLATWAQQLAQWCTQGITIYAFCHCPFEKHSPEICAELYKRVGELVPLPPLNWLQETKDTTKVQQPRLF